MKKIKKCMVAITLLFSIVLCNACGKSGDGNAAGGGSIEGELTDIMADIYENINVDSETKESMQYYMTDTLTADNEQAILGVSGVSYTDGVYSIPMMSSIAYQCVLLRVSPDDVESVKTLLKDNADVDKWVCVSAETVLVENVGDVVLFVMCDKDRAYAISEAFQALGK